MRNGIHLQTTAIDLLRDADPRVRCCRVENLFSTLNLGALKRTTTTPSPEVPKVCMQWHAHTFRILK